MARGTAVTRCSAVQDARGVAATLDDGRRLSARFVVGADGMHSAVRQAAGIAFEGAAYGESFVLADIKLPPFRRQLAWRLSGLVYR
jgi:2-polyprenyl-6-methoxyphenol hydroxylase-like FAD-dependent oxidoreductase